MKKRCRERETVRERERDGWRGENKRLRERENEREKLGFMWESEADGSFRLCPHTSAHTSRQAAPGVPH